MGRPKPSYLLIEVFWWMEVKQVKGQFRIRYPWLLVLIKEVFRILMIKPFFCRSLTIQSREKSRRSTRRFNRNLADMITLVIILIICHPELQHRSLFRNNFLKTIFWTVRGASRRGAWSLATPLGSRREVIKISLNTMMIKMPSLLYNSKNLLMNQTRIFTLWAMPMCIIIWATDRWDLGWSRRGKILQGRLLLLRLGIRLIGLIRLEKGFNRVDSMCWANDLLSKQNFLETAHHRGFRWETYTNKS